MKVVCGLLVLFVILSVALAEAPLYNAGAPAAIPNQYIVVFAKNSTVQIRDFHVSELSALFPYGVQIRRVFDIGTLIGYTANMDKIALARELSHPNIMYIEADQVVSLYEDTETQKDATWGLDRISKVALPLDKTYEYYASAGAGVDAYVIDTGILTSHVEFVGRAHFGANFIDGETGEDCNGHGTHVAGTIAGTTYGVAKKADLWAVKVLSCGGSGSWEGVIGGIDWVAKHHQGKQNKNSVANMSLGGGVSATINAAVAQAVSAGVTMVVAAGNNNADACTFSPASEPSAITVGATQSNDNRASYSNLGKCLDIFAPGTSITSAWITTTTSFNTISGTSMASPHVAGVAALYYGHVHAENQPVPTPAEVTAAILKVATPNKVENPGAKSPNLLLYSLV